MKPLDTLQKFIVAWTDELWWSMRDRVGALSMIECLSNSWQAGGQKIGELAKTERMAPAEAAEVVHAMLGRTVQREGSTIRVTACPYWDRIRERGLEYAYKCEEFVCAPFLTGIKDALGGKQAEVETNLRLAHNARVRLEYKIAKLKSTAPSDPKNQTLLKTLEKELDQLPAKPACIFHMK